MQPQQIYQALTNNPRARLIDVRTPMEYLEIHAETAELIPLDKIDPGELAKDADGQRTCYLICRSGSRARQALEKFKAAGFEDVVCVEGGTLEWERAGLPVVRGRKVIGLERQVRIGAGSLVLLGLMLGWFVHPAFFVLSAFVGGGLVFAGITDWCGMAMVLARMPWNKVRDNNIGTCQTAADPKT